MNETKKNAKLEAASKGELIGRPLKESKTENEIE